MDEIQRKLALIDRQLAGGDFYKRIISTGPLVFAAVGLMAGIVLQEVLFGLSITGDGAQLLWVWVVLLGLCATSAVALFILQAAGRPGSYGPVLIGCCGLACFACLGAIRLISFRQPKANDIRNFVGGRKESARENTENRLHMDSRWSLSRMSVRGGNDKLNDNNSAVSAVKTDGATPATIRGVIVTEPFVNRNREWKFARFKPTDPTSSFYLKLTEVETVTGWAEASGTVRVQVDEPVLDLKAGDCIEAYCRLDKFRPPSNPGQFDTARHLARRNVYVCASVKTRGGIEVLKSPAAAVFTKVRRKIRETTAQALLGSLPPEDPSRGLLEALLLGYRGNIDSETYQAFRRTNLLHFVSLSGLHFGILIGIVWWVCKTAGLLKRGRALICIFAIAVFLMVVPPRAPTVRAAIIGWVFCASLLLRRHSNPINTLSLAAIILLLIRPSQLFEAGWQLSFATVLGILLFEERIEYSVGEALDKFFSEVEYRQFWTAARLMRKCAALIVPLFSVGLAAWLGGAGILLYHFYTITPLASVWTVLVFPLVGAILTLGFVKTVLFFLLPTLSAALGVLVTLLSNMLIWVVKLLAQLDFLRILAGHVGLWLVVLYYCFILFACFVHFRRPRTKKVICWVMLTVIIVFLVGMKWQRTHRSDLVVTCLDVSHGQAIFVELPGKANLLFDAGSLHKSDIGRRVVSPFLDYKGISKIDTVFISHNDIDHINGIPEVTEYCEVEQVYANAGFFDEKDEWGTAKCLNDALNQQGIEIRRLGKELNLGRDTHIKILWPGEQMSLEELGDNDKSSVSLIEFAGRRILLCSDIEKFAQREILRLNPDIRADVVVAPHHGSTTTAEPDFLKKLEPDILICSCGRREYETQRKIESQGAAQHFYTPEHGTVTIRIAKDGIITTTCAGQNRTP